MSILPGWVLVAVGAFALTQHYDGHLAIRHPEFYEGKSNANVERPESPKRFDVEDALLTVCGWAVTKNGKAAPTGYLVAHDPRKKEAPMYALFFRDGTDLFALTRKGLEVRITGNRIPGRDFAEYRVIVVDRYRLEVK